MNSSPVKNPYTPPMVSETPRPDRLLWIYFLIGFRNGALWSLLVLVLAVPGIYEELTITRRREFNSNSGRFELRSLSGSEQTYCGIEALVGGLCGVTLPWATTAGFVRISQERKRRYRRSAS